MDKTQLQLEALKMIKDWSAWLVGIQTVICGFLWNALKENPILAASEIKDALNPSITGIILHLGWLAFVISLLIAAFTLLRVPRLVETLKQGEDETESVFAMQADLWGRKLKMKTLAGTQFFFFLAGAALTAAFVIISTRHPH
jgi:hypothetical protein